MLRGVEPPADLLDRLGGWTALEALAPTLVDKPLLTAAVSLLARDAGASAASGDDLASMESAAAAIATAVLDSTDSMQFAHNIDVLCADAALLDLIGGQLAARCLTLAVSPRTDGDDPADSAVLRHAVALEAVARLAVKGHASKYKLLGVLEDVVEPQPRRYAQAVVRTVALAFDHWPLDVEVAGVIDILTGETAPAYAVTPDAAVRSRNAEYRLDIGADAMWAKANVAVARALRSSTAEEVVARLDEALAALEFVTRVADRDDGALLQSALRLLRGMLVSLDGSGGPQDASTWDASRTEAEAIARRADELTLSSHGLNHWSGDRKAAVLRGWSRFAHDLAYLRDHLDRDSLYEAAVVLDDILAIYSASRAYELTRNDHGVDHVLEVLRPAVAGGFAARGGLLRNLADHTHALRRRVGRADKSGQQADDLRRRLATAEAVLQAARTSLATAAEPPGKQHEQAAVPLPPLLAELMSPYPTVAIAAGSEPAELAALAADLADRQAAADPDPDVMVTGVRKRMLAELAACGDFTGDVPEAAATVLDQLIKFVRQRLNSQESSKPYLFDADANEGDLHLDLYDWLSQGQLGSLTNVEVQEVGAGRVDIQIQFAGFHFYLELKADETAVPVEDKAAYIKQTVSYQATDVRIGFLVVLRKTPPKGKSPSLHLTEYVSHTTVSVNGSDVERHVVMLEVPGNQTKPSGVR